jgi:hypothetical protein
MRRYRLGDMFKCPKHDVDNGPRSKRKWFASHVVPVPAQLLLANILT